MHRGGAGDRAVLSVLARWPLVIRVVGVRLAEPSRRLLRSVFVVPVPPLVRWTLRVAVWRVFPFLLAPKGSHAEESPGGDECLIAAVVDEVRLEYPAVVVTDERDGAMPLVDTEILVEVVGDR